MNTDRDENDDSPFGAISALIWAIPLGLLAWAVIIWGCWTIWEMVA